MTEKIWTKELVNGALTLDSSYSFTYIKVVLTSGSATIQGSATAGGVTSGPINLVSNQPVEIEGDSGSIIDSLIVTASSGTVQIIARQ